MDVINPLLVKVTREYFRHKSVACLFRRIAAVLTCVYAQQARCVQHVSVSGYVYLAHMINMLPEPRQYRILRWPTYRGKSRRDENVWNCPGIAEETRVAPWLQ